MPSALSRSRETGSALFLCILILSLLMALMIAHSAVTQKGVQQTRYFYARSALTVYAESGLEMGLYDLIYDVTGNGGNVGTLGWSKALHDLGRDGLAGTADEGEGDGIPTPGEPQVQPVPYGSARLGAGLTVYVEDGGTPDVKRLVATAVNSDAMATVETLVSKVSVEIPATGCVHVQPLTVLDLKSGDFRINGNDHALDGTPERGDAVVGISTPRGDTEGENLAMLQSQIDLAHHHQVQGDGGAPSVGEVPPFDLPALFARFRAVRTVTLGSGTYSKLNTGDLAAGEVAVVYASGDVQITGNGHSGGVLVVDGSLTITGEFRFDGLILVNGDLTVSGGGSDLHLLGALLVGESLTTGDGTASFTGTADLMYSSEALELIERHAPSAYSRFFYAER